MLRLFLSYPKTDYVGVSCVLLYHRMGGVTRHSGLWRHEIGTIFSPTEWKLSAFRVVKCIETIREMKWLFVTGLGYLAHLELSFKVNGKMSQI